MVSFPTSSRRSFSRAFLKTLSLCGVSRWCYVMATGYRVFYWCVLPISTCDLWLCLRSATRLTDRRDNAPSGGCELSTKMAPNHTLTRLRKCWQQQQQQHHHQQQQQQPPNYDLRVVETCHDKLHTRQRSRIQTQSTAHWLCIDGAWWKKSHKKAK